MMPDLIKLIKACRLEGQLPVININNNTKVTHKAELKVKSLTVMNMYDNKVRIQSNLINFLLFFSSLFSFFQTSRQDVSEGLGPHLSLHYKARTLQPQPQLSGRRQPSSAQPWKLFLRHKLQLWAPDQRPQSQQWAGLTRPLWSHSGVGQQCRNK